MATAVHGQACAARTSSSKRTGRFATLLYRNSMVVMEGDMMCIEPACILLSGIAFVASRTPHVHIILFPPLGNSQRFRLLKRMCAICMLLHTCTFIADQTAIAGLRQAADCCA